MVISPLEYAIRKLNTRKPLHWTGTEEDTLSLTEKCAANHLRSVLLGKTFLLRDAARP